MTRSPTSTQRNYKAPAYTTRDEWDPAAIKRARRAAETGNLRLAADLCEYLQSDDRISGVLRTRLYGLMKLDTSIEDDAGETYPAQDIADALNTDFWNAYPEDDLAELQAWGHILGIGIGEHRWTLDAKTGRLLPRLHVWHPRWLRYNDQTDTWHLTTTDGEIQVDDTDGKWVFYTPYGTNAPWRKGAYRTLGHFWLLKRYALIDWGTYSEAHGNPIRVGTTPEGSSKPDRDELAQDLQNITGVTGIGLPPGFDLKLVEARADTAETFEKQINMADTAIAIAIAGQNLTTEVKGGSYAAATVHDQIRHDYIEHDEQVLSTTVHYATLTWWALFNFGTEDIPWIRWNTEPGTNIEIEAHHLDAGVVTRNELRDRLGLDPMDGPEGDELIRTGAAAAPPPPAALSTTGQPVRLASGEDPRNARGFIRGQLYVDRIAARATPLDSLARNAEQLATAIRGAKSYDELLKRIEDLHETMDPDEVAGLMEALIMTDLAGRAAVIEDA